MAQSDDPWTAVRAIIQSTKKRLLKKPNYALAVTQLQQLSLRLQDEEVFEHAAVCHVEAADLCQKLGNVHDQRKQLMLAAQLYRIAYKKHCERTSRVLSYYPSELANLYAKAVKISIDEKMYRYAGLQSLEASRVLADCGQHVIALEHAYRTVRLCAGDLYSHLHSYDALAECLFALNLFDNLLACVDEMWLTVMKSRCRTHLIRKRIKECEVLAVLLLLLVKITASGRHKVLLAMYGLQTSSGMPKSPARASSVDDSALSTEEFNSFFVLLYLLRNGNYQFVEKMLSGPCEVSEEVAKSLGTETRVFDCSFVSGLSKRICFRVMKQ